MRSYEHQTRIVNEAMGNLVQHGYHAVFAEVGTGKSRMILTMADRLQAVGIIKALLIVAPKSLAGTWRDQVEQHCEISGHSFVVFDAAKAATRKWQAAYDYALSHDFPIVFANVEAFQSMPATLVAALKRLPTGKYLMAVDESSTIKGPKAKRTTNVTKWGQNARARIVSTGTEITQSVLDLYSQFEFLKPGFWGFKSFFFFKNYYAILEERYLSGGRTFKEITGFRKLDELQAQIAPFVSRARKKDCLDLPAQIHARMPVAMNGECRRVYEELKKDLMVMLESGQLLTVTNKIALFTKFRQITGGTLAGIGVIEEEPTKVLALMDEVRDHNEQAIIWSCFTEEINLLVGKLSKEWTIARFDGKTNEKDRESAISDFRSGKARFFVANPAAASQGLNLQNAHLQYWISLPTRADQYEQAEGRIHRSGQTEKCLYKSLLCEGTVDWRLDQLLREKTDIMQSFRDGTVADVLEVV